MNWHVEPRSYVIVNDVTTDSRRRKRGGEEKGAAKRDARYEAAETGIRSGVSCGVCGQNPSGKRGSALVIDHCHDTGLVRGVLCHACNVQLGRLGDRIGPVKAARDKLQRMADYLDRFERSLAP